MASKRIKRILSLIEELTESERLQFINQSTDVLSKIQFESLKNRPTVNKRTDCPHCQSEKLRKYGFYKGRKRFKCLSCGRTFNQLSDSAIFGTHFPEKWPKFVSCMVDGLSVAKTAQKI